MQNLENADWEISILLPAGEVPVAAAAGPVESATAHSIPLFGRAKAITQVSGKAVQDQWSETVANLLKLSEAVSAQAGAWQIGELEVGLTLGAKGQLLFIAEASAQATIKVKLVRKPARAPFKPRRA